MCVCPELLDTADFPGDAKAKARRILSDTKGSSMGRLFWCLDVFNNQNLISPYSINTLVCPAYDCLRAVLKGILINILISFNNFTTFLLYVKVRTQILKVWKVFEIMWPNTSLTVMVDMLQILAAFILQVELVRALGWVAVPMFQATVKPPLADTSCKWSLS